MAVSYEIQKRTDTAFAVVRNGPKDETREFEVYTNWDTASYVCDTLNRVARHVR